MNIGERLLKLRKQKGLSQEEIANIIGVSRQTISKWETGESNPDFDKIIPLCDLYNITTDELIRGEVNTKNESNKEEHVDKVTENKDDNQTYESYKPVKKYEALVVSISIFLYFIAIVWIILIESLNIISDELIVSIFLVIAAIPTCLLTYYYISVANKKRYLKEYSNHKEKLEYVEEKIKKKYKEIDDIIALIFLIIYLYISFVTRGWYITWILWIVYSLAIKIVHLILDAKEDKK